MPPAGLTPKIFPFPVVHRATARGKGNSPFPMEALLHRSCSRSGAASAGSLSTFVRILQESDRG